MGMLYVEVSKYSKETDKFENIGEIRSKFSLTSPANRLTEWFILFNYKTC